MKSLREMFREIPDDRAWHIYNLEGVLTLICLAMLCGCDGERSIARWAQEYRWEYAERLGFKPYRMPKLGT